jgi:hypothetical protein
MARGEYVRAGDYAVIGQALQGIYISALGLLKILIFINFTPPAQPVDFETAKVLAKHEITGKLDHQKVKRQFNGFL